MSVLTLNNVKYKYNGTNKYILKGVNADFEKGKLYVITGKSGTGKSTLLSLISGLDIATEGSILCDGKDLKDINRDVYRAKNIGVIFQGYNLLTNATALENIVLSMNISGVKGKNKTEEATQLLSKVGINSEKAGRKVLKLSGGEQQRVGIARAISHNPDIIIADEPTGNLDAATEKSIMSIFQDFAHEQNKCVIIVTHSNQVAKYGDQVWALNQGNLLFIKERKQNIN